MVLPTKSGPSPEPGTGRGSTRNWMNFKFCQVLANGDTSHTPPSHRKGLTFDTLSDFSQVRKWRSGDSPGPTDQTLSLPQREFSGHGASLTASPEPGYSGTAVLVTCAAGSGSVVAAPTPLCHQKPSHQPPPLVPPL